MPRLRRLVPEFRDGSIERAFLRWSAAPRRRLARGLIAWSAVLYVLAALTEWRSLGPTTPFWILLGMRLAFGVAAAIFWFASKRLSVSWLERTLFALSLFAAATFGYAVEVRTAEPFTYHVISYVGMAAVFCAAPLGWRLLCVAQLVLLGTLAIGGRHALFDEWLISGLIAALILGLGLGVGFAVGRMQRFEFATRRILVATEARATRAMAARSLMTAQISHELRTPLNAMVGAVQVLRGETDPQRAAEMLRVIEAAGDQLDLMIGAAIDIARIEQGEFDLRIEAVDPLPLIQSTVRMLRQQAYLAGVRLRLAPHGMPASLLASPLALRQIVLNLVENAIKFAPRGGTVDVVLRPSAAVAGHAELLVRDDGPGFGETDPSILLRPFERGAQTASRPGSGLGLSIVRRLVEGQGGQILLANRPEGGAEVQVVLPLAEAADARREVVG